MAMDSAARIELGRSLHQQGTVHVKVCESDLYKENFAFNKKYIIFLIYKKMKIRDLFQKYKKTSDRSKSFLNVFFLSFK